MPRRPRQPTPEELAMWKQVTSDVEPIDRVIVDPAPELPTPLTVRAADFHPAPAKRKSTEKLLPQMLDRKTVRRIKARREAVDSKIDLHGMAASQARDALTRFIMLAAENGQRTLLVITGKGGVNTGVLRREFPHWLELPPLSSLVLGFHVAHRADGGEGAFYVRLRQQRIGR